MDFLVQNALDSANELASSQTDDMNIGQANIKVLGCGGAGNNMADWLYRKGIKGAEIISVDDERERLEPTLKEIKKVFDVPISIDTYKSEIMKLSIDYGVDMINDIYALQKSGTIEVISTSWGPFCLTPLSNFKSSRFTCPEITKA